MILAGHSAQCNHRSSDVDEGGSQDREGALCRPGTEAGPPAAARTRETGGGRSRAAWEPLEGRAPSGPSCPSDPEAGDRPCAYVHRSARGPLFQQQQETACLLDLCPRAAAVTITSQMAELGLQGH